MAAGYLYSYACHEDERSLCRLEQRTMFGFEPREPAFIADVRVEASRSPFMKERIELLCEDGNVSGLAERVEALGLHAASFKVQYVKTGDDIPYEERRAVEHRLGRTIRGTAEMRAPETVYGIARIGGRWMFGHYTANEALWHKHMQKPQNYSTALSTRVARAVVNIAVPDVSGKPKVIDPCCGIGTVLIEALSMGVDIAGTDRNGMAVRGARLNLNHFGYPDVVAKADMRTLSGSYDAAIVDLPYNLCSKLPDEERDQMLQSVRRIAARAVVIATEPLDEALDSAGFSIIDSCTIKKGAFARYLYVGI